MVKQANLAYRRLYHQVTFGYQSHLLLSFLFKIRQKVQRISADLGLLLLYEVSPRLYTGT